MFQADLTEPTGINVATSFRDKLHKLKGSTVIKNNYARYVVYVCTCIGILYPEWISNR